MLPDRRIVRTIGLITVLKMLESSRMSGYELIAALSRRAGSDPLPGGHCELYAHLYLLEAKGLVRGEWETLNSGRRRRYYHLTRRGHRRLARYGAGLRAVGRLLAGADGLLGASPAEYIWKGVPT